jgi:hypothetical protein
VRFLTPTILLIRQGFKIQSKAWKDLFLVSGNFPAATAAMEFVVMIDELSRASSGASDLEASPTARRLAPNPGWLSISFVDFSAGAKSSLLG